MEAKKEIKVYGTLVNYTLDSDKADTEHHDAIAYAKELFDDNFGASPNTENYQDNINKRISKIKYDSSKPGTVVEGDLYVDGIIYMKKDGVYVPIDLGNIINRITNLESLWHLEDGKVVSNRPAQAAAFYDSTITQS